MDPLLDGEVLEVRSRERTVADDLPAWCRMVSHQLIKKAFNQFTELLGGLFCFR